MTNVIDINEADNRKGRIMRMRYKIDKAIQEVLSNGYPHEPLETINALMLAVQGWINCLPPEKKDTAKQMFQIMLEQDV